MAFHVRVRQVTCESEHKGELERPHPRTTRTARAIPLLCVLPNHPPTNSIFYLRELLFLLPVDPEIFFQLKVVENDCRGDDANQNGVLLFSAQNSLFSCREARHSLAISELFLVVFC